MAGRRADVRHGSVIFQADAGGRVHRHGRGAGGCLLYTSDAADERSSVDLGGRRIIKKKNISQEVGGRGD